MLFLENKRLFVISLWIFFILYDIAAFLVGCHRLCLILTRKKNTIKTENNVSIKTFISENNVGNVPIWALKGVGTITTDRFLGSITGLMGLGLARLPIAVC